MGMIRVVKARSRRGVKAVERLARRGRSVLDRKVLAAAERIVDGVRRRGDRALLKAVRRYDGVAADGVAALRATPRPGGEAHLLPAGFEEALERSIAAVERYHGEQVREGYRLEEDGIELVARRVALRRVGIYVPGGRAAYPSTVVMTAVPARLAGVEEIVVATPAKAWEQSATLRHTVARLGIDEVWTIGGAHAVAALAYGTETIRPVDKVVGPGNAWVTAAKHLVSAEVGIDLLAGPSEVVIVALGEADPGLLAADLLAQAEHDPEALPLLVTDGKRLARRVLGEVERQLAALATAAVARQALEHTGVALLVDGAEEALELVERLAPEHLQLVGEAAEALAPRVRSAGAVFVGAATPEVFGDYLAGPSHVLPTGGTARFASALGVDDFVRRSHLVRYTPAAAARSAVAAAILAASEGLPAHAAAARRRQEEAR